MEQIAALLVTAIAVIILLLYIYSISWAYNDAESQGKSGCLVALLVALFNWPLGLLLWLIFRPEGRGRR